MTNTHLQPRVTRSTRLLTGVSTPTFMVGWALYRSKGGTDVFNCIPVELDEEDLDKLEKEYKSLATATGFFWGASHTDDDIDTAWFIEKARSILLTAIPSNGILGGSLDRQAATR